MKWTLGALVLASLPLCVPFPGGEWWCPDEAINARYAQSWEGSRWATKEISSWRVTSYYPRDRSTGQMTSRAELGGAGEPATGDNRKEMSSESVVLAATRGGGGPAPPFCRDCRTPTFCSSPDRTLWGEIRLVSASAFTATVEVTVSDWKPGLSVHVVGVAAPKTPLGPTSRQYHYEWIDTGKTGKQTRRFQGRMCVKDRECCVLVWVPVGDGLQPHNIKIGAKR